MVIGEDVSLDYEKSTLINLLRVHQNTPDYTKILKSPQNRRKIKYPDPHK
jgi:hypothetical protein